MRDNGTSSKKSEDDRKSRLAEALRANLRKRKAQSRSRRTGEADTRVEELPEAPRRSED